MNIHEYQAKELLAKYGAPIAAGFAAFSVDDAVAAAGKLPGPLYVVKAQIAARASSRNSAPMQRAAYGSPRHWMR
jgi:succinyl-CoA synthetase beta subunit